MIELLQVVLNVLLRHADEIQFAPDRMWQGVKRLEIQRIGDRDGESQSFVLHRDHPVAFGDVLGNGLGDTRIERVVCEPDEWNSGICSQCFRHIVLSEGGVRQKVLDDRLTPGKGASRVGDFIGAHHSGFGKQFGKIIFVGKHWALSP